MKNLLEGTKFLNALISEFPMKMVQKVYSKTLIFTILHLKEWCYLT